MINLLWSRLQRPEQGWDPVPPSHALRYAGREWAAGVNDDLLDELEECLGGFSGKHVLDLGGGPGQYSVAFAKRGAEVAWFDVSRRYKEYAELKAREAGVSVVFFLGYMDEAREVLNRQFDLVFNRICWYYCQSDARFAAVIYSLIRPGGWAYIDTNHSGVGRESLSRSTRVRTWLNDKFAVKIGHPFPPRGRVARLFLRYPIGRLVVDYSSASNDRVFVQKSEDQT